MGEKNLAELRAIYEKLNQKQKYLVHLLAKNILLMAPAGTGKTNTLSIRIANILTKNLAMPDEILCLTFTNKATRELKNRVVGMIENGNQIEVRTFHSFCFQILKAEAKRNSDFFTDFVIYDEEDCYSLIRTYLKVDHYEALFKLISLVKNERALISAFSDDAKIDYENTIKYLYEKKPSEVFSCCLDKNFNQIPKMMDYFKVKGSFIMTFYDYLLRENHAMDFNDLVMKTKELFVRCPEIHKYWQEKYKFINIDEIQDTSKLEFEILKHLFSQNNNILLAGDINQTIYEWRGSAPVEIISEFEKKFNPEIIYFDENYRSTETLLKASSGAIKSLFGNSAQKYNSYDFKVHSKDKGNPIFLHVANTLDDEAEWIYQALQNIPEDELKDACILTRRNLDSKLLSDKFREINRIFNQGYTFGNGKKINFQLVEELKFFRKQEIKDLIAFLKLTINKSDSISLRRVLKRFIKGVGEETIKKVESNEYYSAGIRLHDFLDYNTYLYQDPYGKLLDALKNGNVVVYDVEATGTNTVEDEIIQIAAIQVQMGTDVFNSNWNISEIARFKEFLKNEKSVGSSENVHHFSDKFLLENGKNPKDIIENFLKFIDGKVLIGHNIAFDISILQSYASRLGIECPVITDYYDTLDIYRRFYPNLKNHKLEYLGNLFHVKHKSSHDAFDDILATAELLEYAVINNIKPTEEIRKNKIRPYLTKMEPIKDYVQKYYQMSYQKYPSQILEMILDDFQVDMVHHYSNQEEQAQHMKTFVRIAKDMEETKEEKNNSYIPYRQYLLELISYTALSTNELESISKSQCKIPITTVHQAKGSEFKHVFLACFQDDIFPTRRSLKDGKIDEEKRLFYVAITRAKKNLYISGSSFGKNNRVSYLSRFLNNIEPKYIKQI